MDVILAALQLLAHLLEVVKAYFELKGSKKDDDRHNAQGSTNRPKHLRD